MSKKKLLTLAIVVMMVAILSYSTLAWFQAQDSVTNDFTILDSLNDFEIDVWEEIAGEGEVGKGVLDADQPTRVEFENVVPGEKYMKKVHIENTSENVLAGQYIMVKVTFTNYDILEKMNGADAGYDCTEMLLGGHFASEKELVKDNVEWWYDKSETVEEDGNITYTFYLARELKYEKPVGNETPDANIAVLFDEVMLPTTMDINDADELINYGGFEIQVVAYAIQSANVVDGEVYNGMSDLDKAVYAFKDQWDKNPDSPVQPTTPSGEATEVPEG